MTVRIESPNRPAPARSSSRLRATPSRAGRTDSCAVVLSDAVGDSMMMMALAYNLFRNGYAPEVYGRVPEQLADWFPWCAIARTPPPAVYDHVLELYRSPTGDALSRDGQSTALASLPGYTEAELTLDRILGVGAAHLGLRDLVRSNGIERPAHVPGGRHAGRVVIHPTASHPEKTWERAKFSALAQALIDRGLQPCFIVTPDERAAWQGEERHGCEVVAATSLDGVAATIVQAGWFIGNDSGPGHLASALGVPTVSLFMRRGLARTWRPSFGHGRVVLPRNLLPGAWLRERCWQRMLSVRRVLRDFDDLRKEVEGAARLHPSMPVVQVLRPGECRESVRDD